MVPKLYVFLGLIGFGLAEYKVPEVTIEAFQPKGFRAYIRDEPGLQLFGFHGQINSELDITKPGEFSKDVIKPEGSYWVYDEPNVALEVGDTLYYWVFIQHSRLGYRKESKWNVKGFTTKAPLECELSMTSVAGKGNVCRDTLIYSENFGSIDQSRWIIEHYIPRGPNYEFNSYENSPDTVYIKSNVLRIKPIPKQTEAEIRGTLDLRFQCTRKKYLDECIHHHSGAQFLPPVKSGKIRSKFSFLFGKIEVQAKLPAGDWIFPEIALIPVNEIENANTSKIWIAYARGNDNLKGDNNDDIGGRTLFAGEVSGPTEPARSSNLVSTHGTEPYTQRKHLYTLVWKPGRISAYVDNALIGEKILDSVVTECVISLGVGVGGINDFPNGYKSGTTEKPWMNRDVKQIKKFFTARNEWMSTWKDPATELQVDSIKIYAI